jgi:DMSO reductase anchor subunit
MAVAMAAVLFTAGLRRACTWPIRAMAGAPRAVSPFVAVAQAVFAVAGIRSPHFLMARCPRRAQPGSGRRRAAVVARTVVLVCTAMIYACLKTVPHWRSWHTVLGYPLFGLMSGALLWLATSTARRPIRHCRHADARRAMLAAAAGGRRCACCPFPALRAGPALPSLNAAIGLPPGGSRFDVGHSPYLLTDEFVFALARAGSSACWVAGTRFRAPGLLLAIAPRWSALAVTSCLAGLLVERWLFFAEARHVVRVYHGDGAR